MNDCIEQINEKDRKKNYNQNEKYLIEFSEWLKANNIDDKKSYQYLKDANFYFLTYLNQCNTNSMIEGSIYLYDFFTDFFIRRCVWSNAKTIKEYTASLTMFYKCMYELNHISEEHYTEVCDEFKYNLEEYLQALNEYDNGIYYRWFFY